MKKILIVLISTFLSFFIFYILFFLSVHFEGYEKNPVLFTSINKLNFHKNYSKKLHHIRDMTLGMGRNPLEVIPLCIPHHRTGKESFHENSKGFSKKWGSQRSLLKEVLDLLADGCCRECV